MASLESAAFSLRRLAVRNTSAVSQAGRWIFSANDPTAVDGESCLIHNTWEFSFFASSAAWMGVGHLLCSVGQKAVALSIAEI